MKTSPPGIIPGGLFVLLKHNNSNLLCTYLKALIQSVVGVDMDRLESQQLANIVTRLNTIDSLLYNISNVFSSIETDQQTIVQNQEKMMTDLNTFTTQLSDKLSSIETLDDSLFTLLSTLSAEVAANKNDPAALDAILARVDADKTKLMNAVVANTPVVAPAVAVDPAPAAPAAPVTDPASTTGTTTTVDPTPASTATSNS